MCQVWFPNAVLPFHRRRLHWPLFYIPASFYRRGPMLLLPFRIKSFAVCPQRLAIASCLKALAWIEYLHLNQFALAFFTTLLSLEKIIDCRNQIFVHKCVKRLFHKGARIRLHLVNPTVCPVISTAAFNNVRNGAWVPPLRIGVCGITRGIIDQR